MTLMTRDPIKLRPKPTAVSKLLKVTLYIILDSIPQDQLTAVPISRNSLKEYVKAGRRHFEHLLSLK